MGSFIKRFVNRHLNLFNFFTASIIIIICLVVLLPAVHLPLDSSTTQAHEDAEAQQDNNNNNNNNHHEDHHHHHRIPTGEVLVCAGFFVFHSIGLLISGRKMEEREPLLIAERKTSTVCCSSTRCPASRAEVVIPVAGNSHEQMLEGAPMIYNSSGGQEDDCVLLLNQHHQHHTHNTHHEHVAYPSMATRSGYGSMEPDLVRNLVRANDNNNNNNNNNKMRHSRVYVEEIKASSVRDDDTALRWPLSIKVGLFAIIFAISLVLFDFKIYGLMDAIQVFRAASVGALLYMAFFLVLPKNPAGCGSCSKEETSGHI